MICFDNDGKVIRENLNVSGGYLISQFVVAQVCDGFLINAKLYYSQNYRSIAICGQAIQSPKAYINCLFFKIDRNFKYLNHEINFFQINGLLHLATSNSNILCVDSQYKYYYLEMNLAVISDKPLDAITTQVGNTIIGVEMNDKLAFFLCSSKKLKIFNVQTGNLIKEIETNANQIKLVPTEYFILFDSINRHVHLYEQFGEFRKLDDVDLAQSLETGLIINRDQSKDLVFYNSTSMKYTCLDSLINYQKN
jgi:hypothetical protein